MAEKAHFQLLCSDFWFPTSDFKLSTEFLKFKRNSRLSILPVFV